MSADMVPLPTAVGPARTVSRRGSGGIVAAPEPTRSAVEALDERGDLVRAEAADTAGLGDADLFHDLPGAHLAHAGQRLEEGGDLDLADDLVRLPLLDDVPEGALGVLQPVLHLGACTACGRSLLQGGGPLLGGQGRQCHVGHLGSIGTSGVGTIVQVRWYGRSMAPPPQATNLPTPRPARQRGGTNQVTPGGSGRRTPAGRRPAPPRPPSAARAAARRRPRTGVRTPRAAPPGSRWAGHAAAQGRRRAR